MNSGFLFWTLALSLQLTNARNIAGVPGEEYKVWAKEGSQAILPCILSPQKLKSTWRQLYKGLVVRWVWHGDSSHKRRRLVLKMEPSGLKKMGLFTKHRTTVWDPGFLRGNFSLQIDPLLKEDAGIYEALVKYGRNLWRCKVKLGVVTVAASPPGPLVESEAVKLSCSSTHPEKPTKIRWFHADVLVHPVTGRFIPLDHSLSISRLVSSDSGPWVCDLSFASGERIYATHNLQVIGFAETMVSVVYTAAGSDAHLPCALNYNPTDYGISKVAFHWSYMAREEIRAMPIPSHGRNRHFSLHLPAVGLEDAGQYLCEITLQDTTTITKNVTLAVMRVTTNAEAAVVTEGSHLLLTCNLSYHTGNEHFQWRQLGFGSWPAAASSPAEVSSWEPTLEFPAVSLNDGGTWECSVYGPDGQLASIQYHLEIAGTQTSSSQPVNAKVIPGLILAFIVLVALVLALTLLRKRRASPNFPALDRMVPTLREKGVKSGDQEEKVLKIEY
ncbi:lymphocyte activation gene 3 protein [Pogona vitticeps]